RAQTPEAVGKAGVECPERLGVVPAVVEEKGIEHDAALPNELLAECLNGADGLRLRVLREIADVVPGVVMQERPVRVRALAFEVCEKVAPHLSRTRGADHR